MAPRSASAFPGSPVPGGPLHGRKIIPGFSTSESRGNNLSKAITRICKNIVDDPAFNTFTMILTIYALFGDDLRLAATSEPADVIFDWITGIALVVFTFECAACSVCKEEYFLSFFFWLDLIATVSLVLDITTVAKMISGGGSGQLKAGIKP